jgi:hypothetical protein
MTTEQLIITGASAFYGLLITALSWAWRRTVSEQDRLRGDVDGLIQALTRQEERTARLMDVETALAGKIDRVLAELGDIRERLARWESSQR